MAAQRRVEYNQISLDACVLQLLSLHLMIALGLMVIDDQSLLQPRTRSLSIATRRTRVRQSLLLCSDIYQEISWNSTQMSQIAVVLTGSYSLIYLDHLMPR